MKRMGKLLCMLMMSVALVWTVPFTSHAQMNPATELEMGKPFGNIQFCTNNDSGYARVQFFGGYTSITGGVTFKSNSNWTLDNVPYVDQSGTYYFTITICESKSTEDIKNGITTKSEEYVYTRPAAEMGTPTNLRWSETSVGTAEWDAVPGAKEYRAFLYDNEGHLLAHSFSETTSTNFSRFMTDLGTKQYCFSVIALSENVEEIAHSQRAENSALYPAASNENKDDSKTDDNQNGQDAGNQNQDSGKNNTDTQDNTTTPSDTKTDTPSNTDENNQPTQNEEPTEVAVTGVTLSKKTVSIAKGKIFTLKASIKPSDAATKLTWKSSNTKIATVSKSGKVKGIKKGTVIITATTENGKTATCKVTVTEPVKSVKFAKKSYTLKKGKTIILKPTIAPKTASNKDVTWKSSNKKIVKIDKNGKVKGLRKGTVTITVTTKDGKKTAKCKVIVK